MILTYKYRIKDRRAKRTLAQHAIAVNQVWNYCVAYQRDIEARYRLGAPKRRWPSFFTLCKLTAGTDLPIRSGTIERACRQFAAARDARKGAVRFRASFGPRRALGWVPFRDRNVSVAENAVTYAGRPYRFFGSKRRPVPDAIKEGCFTEDSLGRWWVCFQVEVEDRSTSAESSIGIDLGLKSFATLSDGRAIEAPRIYRRHEQRLAVAQRARNKQRVRRLHAKIANCRRDFLHKASTELVRNHGLIVVGNVNASKLARTRMAKSVLDAGWSAFRSQLRYKASRHGAVYLEVDEKFTTQTCSSCGSLPPERPKGIAGLGIRAWDCSDCGTRHDRDVNAARNILALARSASRPAEGSQCLG